MLCVLKNVACIFIVSWYVACVLVKVTLISWLVVYFGFILEQAQPVIYLICLLFIFCKKRDYCRGVVLLKTPPGFCIQQEFWVFCRIKDTCVDIYIFGMFQNPIKMPKPTLTLLTSAYFSIPQSSQNTSIMHLGTLGDLFLMCSLFSLYTVLPLNSQFIKFVLFHHGKQGASQ